MHSARLWRVWLLCNGLKVSSSGGLVVTEGEGEPANPKQPALGSFLLCLETSNIRMQGEDVCGSSY